MVCVYEQVAGYKNNCHRVFMSKQAAEDAYSKDVLKQACTVEVGKSD